MMNRSPSENGVLLTHGYHRLYDPDMSSINAIAKAAEVARLSKSWSETQNSDFISFLDSS